MSIVAVTGQASDRLMTHFSSNNTDFDIEPYRKILAQKSVTVLPLSTELEMLIELSQFELGRFLLKNKGLNGYWTSYIINHDPLKSSYDLSPLETWILQQAPSVIATRERFGIFQHVLQDYLFNHIKLASIPCGLMNDLLTLNYKNVEGARLTGIDLDLKSLVLAAQNAEKHKVTNVNFSQKDAWRLDGNQCYDVITSNGLNIYEPDDAKVVQLYKQFHQALKSNGVLVTSFLTPPATWWNINASDAQRQRAIFNDIIGVTWQAVRTQSQTYNQLEQAGFEIEKIIYDTQRIFPTVVARKI